MASDETKQSELWSATDQRVATERDPRRRLLPHDLDVALKYLTDGELQALAAAVGNEQVRRTPNAEGADTSATAEASSPSVTKASKVDGLTQSQVNLIRASIKAGVKPTALSRQFGISQAQVRAALKP